MMWNKAGIFALLLLLPLAAHARQQATMLRFDGLIDLQPDGSYTADTDIDLRVEDDASARRQSQYVLGYEASRETMTVRSAHTLKPDGRRIPVAPAGILEQAAANAGALAGYADPRQKVIIFPEVAPGDRLVASVRRTVFAPLVAGGYTASIAPDLTLAWTAYTMVVRVPPGMRLHTAMEGFDSRVTQDGDRQMFHFRSTAIDPPDEDISAIGRLDRTPRLFVSTFSDQAQFAAGLAAPLRARMRATEPLRAKAAALVAGAIDRRTQVERLYDWLGHSIRYVDNPLSTVAIGLHDAETIFANGYGDSVDAAVLLVTMLDSIGIPAVPVLVNRGTLYSVPGVPTLGPFNHMIVFVPELELYLDANGGTVPFASLPFSELGKPALHLDGATANGASAVRRTPVAAANAATSMTRTILRLDRMGVMIGDTAITATGPFLHTLNEIALQVGREGSIAAGRSRMQALGLDGTAGITVPAARQSMPSMGGTIHIVLAPQMDMFDGTGIPMTPRLGLLPRPGDVLAGPLNVRGLAPNAPTPCFPGVQLERVTLAATPGFKLHRLPKDVLIEAPGLRYETHWESFTGGGAQVERKLTTSFASALCTGTQREALAKALIGIRREQLQQVALDPE